MFSDHIVRDFAQNRGFPIFRDYGQNFWDFAQKTLNGFETKSSIFLLKSLDFDQNVQDFDKINRDFDQKD